MYAACYGDKRILTDITKRLLATYSTEAFSERNCMGNTAARLAKLNGHRKCERLLEKQRIRAISKMFHQLNRIHAAAAARGWAKHWKPFTNVYKAAVTWRTKAQEPIARSRSLIVLNHEMDAEREHFHRFIDIHRSDSHTGRMLMYDMERAAAFGREDVDNVASVKYLPETIGQEADPVRQIGYTLTVVEVPMGWVRLNIFDSRVVGLIWVE